MLYLHLQNSLYMHIGEPYALHMGLPGTAPSSNMSPRRGPMRSPTLLRISLGLIFDLISSRWYCLRHSSFSARSILTKYWDTADLHANCAMPARIGIFRRLQPHSAFSF